MVDENNQSELSNSDKESKKPESSQRIVTFLFIATAIFSFGILLFLANYFGKHQDIRSNASTNITVNTPGKVLNLKFAYEKDASGDVVLDFDDVKIMNGFTPVSSKGNIGNSSFTAIIMGKQQNILGTQNFSVPLIVSIDGLDNTSGGERGETDEVKANSYTVTLPYYNGASYVKVDNVQGETIALLSIEGAQYENNYVNPKPQNGDNYKPKNNQHDSYIHFADKAYASGGTFNIAIIGDNYNGDLSTFQKDVNDIASGLMSIEPFASNKSNIVFYPQLSTVSICSPVSGWPSIKCDDATALSQASSLPYDKVYVLYNGSYTGYAYVGGILSYGTSSTGQNLAVKQGLFIHEMAGHSLGGLMDEYSYGATGIAYGPNCSANSSCTQWSGITGLGCFSTCGYTNLYRATDDSSVMNTSYFRGIISFDNYSTQLVQQKLANFLSAPAPSPTNALTPTSSLTLPPAILSVTPTISALISTTIAPSLSATVSATLPFPSTTVTVTPTLTIAPTSTACSFPNFCTQQKYCTSGKFISGSCGVSDRICCEVQTDLTVANPTVTVQDSNSKVSTFTQVFTSLPVSSPSPTKYFVQSPTATPVVVPTIVTPTLVPAASDTENVSSGKVNLPTLVPSPTSVLSPTIEIYPTITPTSFPTYFYVSPTLFNPDNINYAKVTPSPKPSSLTLSTVGFFEAIFSSVLKSLLPGIFR
ncbi:MAG: M64 family metallo-endopeptidase [Patescibacteria group bacterium]|nr:M64 family metallo-endopeptidase [Patescibacteria group bacterium]